MTIDGQDLETPLTDDHKIAITKLYFSSAAFTNEEKKALSEKAFAGDTSDKVIQAQQVNDYSIPDADLKAKLWEEIANPSSTETLLQYQVKIGGFFNRF